MTVRPTARGAGLAAAGLVAILGAHAFGTQALVPVGVGMIALPLLALGLVALGAAGLRPRRTITPPGARAGDHIEVRTGAGRRAGGLYGRLGALSVDPATGDLGTRPRPLGGGRGVGLLARRGRHLLPPPVLEVADPFGLATATRVGTRGDEIRILPRIVALPAPGRLLRGDWRLAGSRGAQGWSDLDRVREYQSGDPLARIHWRQTAKRGELQTKVMRGSDGERSVTALVLDATGDGGGAAHFEEAVTTTASLAHAIAREGGVPALVCAGPSALAPRAARPAGLDMILAEAGTGGREGDLIEAVRAASATSRGGGVLIVSARARPELRAAARASGGRIGVVLLGEEWHGVAELRAAGVSVVTAAGAAALAATAEGRRVAA